MFRERPLTLVCLLIAIAAGCTGRPAVPFSIPAAGSPAEFQMIRFKWPVGTVLTYQIEQFLELRIGPDRHTAGDRHRLSLTSQGRTAKGLTRVEIRFDGKLLGAALYDNDARLADTETLDRENPSIASELKAMVAFNDSAVFRAGTPEVFRINIPYEMDINASELGDPHLAQIRDPLHLTVRYQGLRRIRERDCIAFVSQLNLTKPVDWVSKEGNAATFDSGGGEELSYYRPGHGYLVVLYRNIILRGPSARGPFEGIFTQLATLDNVRSKEP